MRKLSDTIARLAALRAQRNLHAADSISSDRLLNLIKFGSNPGALRSRYYLPEDLPEGAPLVVVLHGCTQNAAAYDRGSGWSQLADQAGFALLFPEQQRANNPNLCFNWFLPAHTTRDSGEALSIRQMIETMVVAHGLDRKRIFVTGLSAGGAMASVMLATYPEVFSGGAIIAGLPYGSANSVPEAFDRMRGHGGPSEQDLRLVLRGASSHKGPWPTISIWQGSADQLVTSSNADTIAGQWRGVHELDSLPSRSEAGDGHLRRIWCDADGRELIEVHLISGMGHGTPLKTKGDDGIGEAAPYMLDVGISSTRRIAHFWGIATSGSSVIARPWQERHSPPPFHSRATAEAGRQAADQDAALLLPAPESTVRKVIEDALRKAGLMR